MMVTKILLADDHQIVREGLKSLLNSHDDMEVVGEARDGRSAVQMAKDLAPDVVIMDVGMPHLNGIEATRQITSREPEAKVVALSMHADRRFMGEMLKAGAKGYLLKDGAFEELATAIRSVIANKVYLSPRIAYFVNSATEWMLSFSMICRRCVSTVLMLTFRSIAISLVARPSAMSWRTSRSRGVRRAKADVSPLG